MDAVLWRSREGVLIAFPHGGLHQCRGEVSAPRGGDGGGASREHWHRRRTRIISGDGPVRAAEEALTGGSRRHRVWTARRLAARARAGFSSGDAW